MDARRIGIRLALLIIPVIVSLAITALLIAILDEDVTEVVETAWAGAFANKSRVASVVNFWIPLTLASMGLAVTFNAGLWNIGIEGQMVMGAVFASYPALFWDNVSGVILIPASIFLAALGGMLWGLLAGVLKSRFGVHEIFGGVALNFIASNITIYMISGPWEPPEGGSAQATPPFVPSAKLPPIMSDFNVNFLFILLTALSFLGIAFALWRSRWGLMLRATGRNPRSALLLGVPTERVSLSSFAVCGALGGIGGAHRVLHNFNSLRPAPAGGIGFLALLVVLLVAFRAWWIPWVTFAFAAVIAGSTRVNLLMQLDQSLVGVLQGVLVLAILMFNGVRERWFAEPKVIIPDEPLPVASESFPVEN
jgi:simple sugar transport system permease protein